jgi:site-specific DNA-methyltransferase (adenine-specific)
LAFGGTRTFHRLASAIEDAGWEIRDTVMWVYGSGFPKSLDVSKAIDKEAGAEREVVGLSSKQAAGFIRRGRTDEEIFSGVNVQRIPETITTPATHAARQWSGWGTALKPAWEPVIVARKSLDGTVAENVQRHGTGGLNIDGCRIDGPGWSKTDGESGAAFRTGKFMGIVGRGEPTLQFGMRRSLRGRWPANLIHDGSEEVVGLFPRTETHAGVNRKYAGGSMLGLGGVGESRASKGSAARFFYCAKASKQDREEGLEDLRKVRGGPDTFDKRFRQRRGGYYHPLRRNGHPTVKPVALMRYLCRLVTPPGGIVLDPFMGSGSTGKAAMLEGFHFVGIEIDPEYLAIAAARIRAAVPPRLAQGGAAK